jgi:two-component system, cell cycle response regulator
LSKKESRKLELDKLNERIEELREILNEICCTVDESENDMERLTISMYLDELIVEYMKELNNQ